MGRGKAIILGCGGHARVLIDAIMERDEVDILGCVDPKFSAVKEIYRRISMIGNDEVIHAYKSKEILLVNGIGSVELPLLRKRLYNQFSQYRFYSVVHPSSIISPTASLLSGVQVLAGAIINSGARVGKDCIINTGSIIEHDCHIGNHVHVAPGAVLCGGVRVGDCTLIGARSVARQGVTIGQHVLVAAGSIVHRDIPDGAKYVHNKLIES